MIAACTLASGLLACGTYRDNCDSSCESEAAACARQLEQHLPPLPPHAEREGEGATPCSGSLAISHPGKQEMRGARIPPPPAPEQPRAGPEPKSHRRAARASRCEAEPTVGIHLLEEVGNSEHFLLDISSLPVLHQHVHTRSDRTAMPLHRH
jgi:hypothetical protein